MTEKPETKWKEWDGKNNRGMNALSPQTGETGQKLQQGVRTRDGNNEDGNQNLGTFR
jgi:hypothetical protein